MYFSDRFDAGRQLARALMRFQGRDLVVYGMSRGGVVAAAEVARALSAPLEALIALKLGHPSNPEFAIGAVAEDGHVLMDEAWRVSTDPEWLEREVANRIAEARRRRAHYMRDYEPVSVNGKTAILVDDGIATGLTMKLAIRELEHKSPGRVVVAVPIAAQDAADEIADLVDEFVALHIAAHFAGAVGAYYEDFSEVPDYEVTRLLHAAHQRQQGRSAPVAAKSSQ